MLRVVDASLVDFFEPIRLREGICIQKHDVLTLSLPCGQIVPRRKAEVGRRVENA